MARVSKFRPEKMEMLERVLAKEIQVLETKYGNISPELKARLLKDAIDERFVLLVKEHHVGELKKIREEIEHSRHNGIQR